MPPGKNGTSGEREIISFVESALLVEMVMDGGVNGGEFLQTSRLSKLEHGALPMTFIAARYERNLSATITFDC